MSSYWKKKLDELEQSKAKTPSKTTSSDYWGSKLNELQSEKKNIAPATKTKPNNIAPVKVTSADVSSSILGTGQTNFNSVKLEFSDLEEKTTRATELSKKIKDLNYSIQLSKRSTGRNGFNYTKAKEKEDKEKLALAQAEYRNYLEEIGYKDLDELKGAYTEKKAQYKKAEYDLKGEKLAAVSNEADFNQITGKGLATDIDFGKKTRKMNYGKAKGARTSIDKYYAAKMALDERYGTVTDDTGKYEDQVSFYRNMTDAEFKVFEYHLIKDEKNGTSNAKEYIDKLEQNLEVRKAQNTYAEKGDMSNVAKVIYSGEVGLDQFASGVENLFNTEDEYIPVNATQLLGSMYREDLGESGAQLPEALGGATTWQMAYDIGQTTSNMVPSILASAAVGTVSKTAGAALGASLIGASASGNAYQEMLNNGYDKSQARTYSTLVGVAEAGLSYALGGISKLGGTLTGKGISKAVSGITNGFLRYSAELGMHALSEGFEEAAQEALAPVFENIALGYQKNNLEDTDWSQVAYSALLGGITGGLMEATTAGKSNALTKNEKAVVDKVYKDAVAEAEADGKKLTSKEKKKLYDTVLNDMEKGYLSTDTIEEVLGGEDYTAYKNTLDNEEALQKEFDELNKMKQGEMTGEQLDRRAELKEQLAELKETSNKDTLKSQLNDNVFEIVKDSKLAESYNEKSRRGQAFEADLSQYDEKYQGTVKKAVESGILNNTRRTHEFVDFVAKISADKGVLFDFADNEKIRSTGYAVEGKTVNGFVNENGDVVLNVNSAKSLNSTAGHEITHILEGTELYDTLAQTITDYAKSKGDYQGRIEALNKLYEGVYKGEDFADKVNKELVADLVGDYIFTDADFVRKLSTENRNIFEKIYDEIKYLCKVATAGSKEARELEKVKKTFAEVYRESGKAKADTKYSLSAEQETYFKDSKVRDENGNLKVMYHGTSGGGFTVFDTYGSNYGLFGQGSYFTDNKSIAESYTKKGKGENKQVYESYLNITNPMDMDGQADAEAWAKQFPDALFPESGTNEDFYRAMEDYLADEMYSKWEAAEIAIDGIQGMGYDGITHIGGGRVNKNSPRHRVYIAFEPEQIKNIDNVKPTNNPDIRYSLSDSEGTKLSKEQQEYFKDSKAVDENGSLKIVYHGTRNADFTVFKRNVTYFTDNKSMADSYSPNGSMFEGYVNITKPYEIDAKGEKWSAIPIDEATKRFLQEYGASVFKEGGKWRTTPADIASVIEEAVDNGELDYDGIIIKNIDDTGSYYKGEEKHLGTDYIVFNSNQFKNADNKTPTADADIRYSLSEATDTEYMSAVKKGDTETVQRLVDEAAKNSMPNSKVRDASGNLLTVYHGSPSKFTVFKHSKMNTHGNAHGRGFYFTEDKNMAEGYEKDGGQLLKGYLNIEKPLSEDKVTIKKPALVKLIKATCEGEAQNLVEDGGYDSIREALPDTWVSNYVDTYNNTNINDVYREVANIIYSGNDNDVDIIAEITNGGAGTENTLVNTYKVLGYDGVIYTNDFGTHEFVSLVSNQFKSTEPITYDDNGNVIPLSQRFDLKNEDIRYSLSEQGETPKKYGNFNIYGKDVALKKPIAPVKETVTESALPENYAPITEDEANAQARETLETLDDADAPPETNGVYDELPDTTPLDDKALKSIADTLKDTLYLNDKEAQAIQDVVQRYSTTEFPSKEELFDEIKAEFGEKVWTQQDEEIAEVKKHLHNYRINVSQQIKNDIADYSYFHRHHFGKIRFAKDGIPVDTAYQELSEMYPQFFPADITNPTDQLWQIAEVTEMATDTEMSDMLDDETIQEAVEIISAEVANFKESATMAEAEQSASEYLKSIAPLKKPKAEKATEAIRPQPEEQPKLIRVKDADIEQHTAEVLTDEPKVEKKQRGLWSRLVMNFFDKGAPFEKLALKTKNRALDAKFNFMRYADTIAQRVIGKGTNGVKALKDIQSSVEKDGLTKKLYEYLYHKHNIDRMTLADRYEGVENKPVFGYSVTAEMSRSTVAKLEAENPKLIEYANDIYAYNKNLRKQLVDGGVISQETADLWEEMYPHYVPTRRVGDEGLNINVPLDTGKTGVNAPVKRATGGSRDILPLFDTMAQRTIQTYKAVAKNRFGVELKNTLGTTIDRAETSLDEVIDGIDAHEELLQEGKDGRSPTFTVFENGEKVTFEITDEMYDALKPTSEGLAYTNKVANTVGNVHRGLLTEYNPVFLFTNAIKDSQDVMINSQHPVRTYANFPRAVAELLGKRGKWYNEYMENGGEQNTYFDKQTNAFEKDKSGIVKWLGKIGEANNFIERIPRLAEYIASRKTGASVEVAMLDSARVTTNFAAGGDVTKFLNRNGFTFLNASVQGAMQQVRNVREAKANGLKGVIHLAAKVALAGLPAMLLNRLLWDDDEDYAELSDYVKDNYYIVAKYGDGQFVRIPKGRTMAVIQEAFEQVGNALTGNDEVDLKNFLDLAITNLAPNNPLDNNIIAPITQVLRNETWYGDDLVPTRLQDLPAAEQYDESTDAISKWLGEKLNISPYKLNYLLNQYSGGLGDVVMPMLTPEAERGDNSLSGNIIAPFKDKFSTNSTMNNQTVSDFYDTVDELTTNAKSSKATDEDILKYKYMNSVNAELGELYGKKREIQNNSALTDKEKYNQVKDIQKQINSLAKESLNTYNNVSMQGGYASIGDLHYKVNKDGEWEKITDKQYEKQEKVTSGLGISASEYWDNKEEYDFAYESPEKYALAKSVGGYESYKSYTSDLWDIKADKDSSGKSISGSRKEKVADYINNLDADYGEKIILFKSEYNADDTYNYEIIEYLNNRDDISYNDMVAILKELGFTVKSDGSIYWD